MKYTLLIALAAAATLHAEDWTPLFNGKDFTGWAQHSGKAEYRVEDGCVVGKTVAGTGNSFMCTTKEYGDFILEFEFKVPEGMNSGVQFRSQFYDKDTEIEIGGKKKKFPADRVHGYQFEIDPSPRAFIAWMSSARVGGSGPSQQRTMQRQDSARSRAEFVRTLNHAHQVRMHAFQAFEGARG